jgi:hypothetical protein
MNKPAKISVPCALSCNLLEKMDAYWRTASHLGRADLSAGYSETY